MSGTASPPLGPLPTEESGWTAPLTPEQRKEHEAIGQALAAGDRTGPSMEEILRRQRESAPRFLPRNAWKKEQPK